MISIKNQSDKDPVLTGKDPKTGLFVKGNRSGGRPKGSVNRLTALKNELVDNSNFDQVIANYKDMLYSDSPRRRDEALKLTFTLFPREDKLLHEIAQVIINKEVTGSTSHNVSYVKCAKCNHVNNLDDTGAVIIEDNKDNTSDNKGQGGRGAGGPYNSSTPPRPKPDETTKDV